MRKVLLALGVMCLLAVCGAYGYIAYSDLQSTEVDMPPGYRVLCSLEGGKYTIWIPDKGLQDGGFISASVWDSPMSASKFAVLYDLHSKTNPKMYPSDAYEWGDCKNRKGE